jgi:hypothetical protein
MQPHLQLLEKGFNSANFSGVAGWGSLFDGGCCSGSARILSERGGEEEIGRKEEEEEQEEQDEEDGKEVQEVEQVGGGWRWCESNDNGIKNVVVGHHDGNNNRKTQ